MKLAFLYCGEIVKNSNNRVPTDTGKPGKNETTFSSQGKVREF